MWQELAAFGKRIFALNSKVEQHDEEIKALRRDVKELDEKVNGLSRRVDTLTEAIHRLSLELRHDRQDRDRQHENLVLRLNNALLRSQRSLPPGTPSDKIDTEPS